MRFYRYIYLFILSSSVLMQANPMQKIYASVFGDQEVSSEYKTLVQEALDDYGYPRAVSVKKMNTIGSRLVDLQLYSFTLFGIWLNEDLLNSCDINLKKWLIYHEVAHVVHKHHAKAIALTGMIAALSLAQYHFAAHLFQNKSFAGTLAAASGALLFINSLKCFIRAQEKAADLAAVKTLCHNGKKYIAQSYLEYLNNLIKEGQSNENDGWHYDFKDQAEYLKKELFLNS